MNNHEITICITTLNNQSTILETICSVSNASCEKQIMVVDLGSKDSTCKIIQELNIDNLNLIKQNSDNISMARNIAINNCKTPYIVFLSADETLTPFGLRDLIENTTNSSIDLMIGRYLFKKEDKWCQGALCKDSLLHNSCEEQDLKKLYTCNVVSNYPICAMIFKTKIIKEFNILFKDSALFAEQEFCLSYLKRCRNMMLNNDIVCIKKEDSEIKNKVISKSVTDLEQEIKCLQEIILNSQTSDILSFRELQITYFRKIIDCCKTGNIKFDLKNLSVVKQFIIEHKSIVDPFNLYTFFKKNITKFLAEHLVENFIGIHDGIDQLTLARYLKTAFKSNSSDISPVEMDCLFYILVSLHSYNEVMEFSNKILLNVSKFNKTVVYLAFLYRYQTYMKNGFKEQACELVSTAQKQKWLTDNELHSICCTFM